MPGQKLVELEYELLRRAIIIEASSLSFKNKEAIKELNDLITKILPATGTLAKSSGYSEDKLYIASTFIKTGSNSRYVQNDEYAIAFDWNKKNENHFVKIARNDGDLVDPKNITAIIKGAIEYLAFAFNDLLSRDPDQASQASNSDEAENLGQKISDRKGKTNQNPKSHEAKRALEFIKKFDDFVEKGKQAEPREASADEHLATQPKSDIAVADLQNLEQSSQEITAENFTKTHFENFCNYIERNALQYNSYNGQTLCRFADYEFLIERTDDLQIEQIVFACINTKKPHKAEEYKTKEFEAANFESDKSRILAELKTIFPDSNRLNYALKYQPQKSQSYESSR